jgi:hypothetical protein
VDAAAVGAAGFHRTQAPQRRGRCFQRGRRQGRWRRRRRRRRRWARCARARARGHEGVGAAAARARGVATTPGRLVGGGGPVRVLSI